ncbi:MAG: NAD-dependent epimerase/dehydratase family protein [Candidatus Eisenbacteria bacterium]
MTSPRHILLAGGSGLIGGPTARALLAAGHRVTVLTRGLRALPDGAEALVADRKDAASLAHALTGRTFDLSMDFLGYDAGDVARLLDVPGFATRRHVLVSTGQVYLVAAEPRPPFVETDAALPAMAEPEAGTRAHANWVYGMGKRAAETELFARRAAGLDAVALRLPIVQGARDGTRRLWAYLQRMLDGGAVLLPEGGAHPVRFVWAEDVARAVVHLAGGAALPSPAYNLAMPDEPSLRDFLSAAATCLGVTPRFLRVSETECAEAGLDAWMSPFSGPWCSRPDPALAADELGFRTTPSPLWLPKVVRAHLEEPAPEDHPGYAGRAREQALAVRLAGG